MSSSDDKWGPIIHRYTRRQALDDGVLVDCSELAREAGFRYPIAVTARVWHDLIVPDDDSREAGQSETGRLWDVINVLRFSIAKAGDSSEIAFQVIFLFGGDEHKTVDLKSVCGPDDDASPCITIMLPDED